MSLLADWLQAALSPSPLGLAIAILLIVSIPIFLHTFAFRNNSLTTLPSILLVGPSGSGKTSLLTLFERGKSAGTHTSQTPVAVECSLPVGTAAASSQFRSTNDPANQTHKKFLLVDNPGHGKLRYHALDAITKPQNLKGIIFVVDASTLSVGDEALRQTSEYLHDILLLLQKRASAPKSSKAPKELAVLLAANKMDLFTALPAALVKTALETEISKIRVSKSRGLLDSGIGMGDAAEAEEKDDWLGEVGSSDFKFAQMEEFSVSVEVIGGNVTGGDSKNVDKWWNWVGERL